MNADSLDFNRKILHTAWHPSSGEKIIAVAATNNLYIFDGGRQSLDGAPEPMVTSHPEDMEDESR